MTQFVLYQMIHSNVKKVTSSYPALKYHIRFGHL